MGPRLLLNIEALLCQHFICSGPSHHSDSLAYSLYAYMHTLITHSGQKRYIPQTFKYYWYDHTVSLWCLPLAFPVARVTVTACSTYKQNQFVPFSDGDAPLPVWYHRVRLAYAVSTAMRLAYSPPAAPLHSPVKKRDSMESPSSGLHYRRQSRELADIYRRSNSRNGPTEVLPDLVQHGESTPVIYPYARGQCVGLFDMML